MGTDAESEATASVGDLESDKVVLLEGVSPDGEVIGDLGIASTFLTRLELSLACFSEKIANLSIFRMRLATMESEFESFTLEKDRTDLDCIEKDLEFDLLSGVWDSEVRELDSFLDTLQTEITDAGESLSSCNLSGETFIAMKEKLRDSEQCLKQSEEQLSEIKMQSADFQRTLSSFKREENGNGEKGEIVREDVQYWNVNSEIKMQTAEQRRHILRMLEKSLAREMDLEKTCNDFRQIEEELKQRALSLEEELVHVEEEATDVWERWFESDNACEILMGISRDLLGRLQISQFNLSGLSQRESDLRAKHENCMKQLKTRDKTIDKIESSAAEMNDFLLGQTNVVKASLKDTEDKLILANSEAFTLSEKVSSLEKQLKESQIQLLNAKDSAGTYQMQYNALCSEVRDMENLIVELKKSVSNEECRAKNAEAKCKLLTENNTKLNEELLLLKDGGGASERVDLLERQLKESDVRLQHAVASAEASQENQSMLYSTIKDMENVIKDLKSKVSKAETLADSAEEKCIILSESNAELNEELRFLRSRLEFLEGSLHQLEEGKVATAKDIVRRTNVFKNLVTQLAVERELLNKQISSLAIENKTLVVKLKKTYKDPSQVTKDFNRDGGYSARENKEEVSETSATGNEVDRTWKILSPNDNEVIADSRPDVGTVRRIDAGVLNSRHLFLAMLVLIVSAVTYLFQQHKF